MKVSELVDWLRMCPQDFDVVIPNENRSDWAAVESLEVVDEYRQVKLK